MVMNMAFEGTSLIQHVTVAGLCLVAAPLLLQTYSKLTERRNLAQKRERRKRDRQVALLSVRERTETSISDDEMTRITAMPAPQLLTEMQKGMLKPSTVLQAFQRKALQAHDKTYCIAEPLTEAMKWAEELDYLDPKSRLLYGLPVSLKEHIAVKGYDCTICFSKFLYKPMEEDCVIVKVLREEGAVPFIKSNLPQMTAGTYCSNPIYGAVLNPRDCNRATGGSSAGEGAIIASDASPLGFGNDLGGSIREPGAFCGVCGFKPTRGRISLKGLRELLPGQRCVSDSYGPMARDVETLALTMKALLGKYMFDLDPSVPPIAFQENIYHNKGALRIGYYHDDGIIRPDPAVHRAITETKISLEKMGHTLIPWKPLNLERAVAIWQKALLGDGGKLLAKYFVGEVMDATLYDLIPALYLPVWLKHWLASIISYFSPAFAQKIKASAGVGSVSGWWKLITESEEYTEEFFENWKKLNLDAVICPASPHQAPPVDQVANTDGAADGYNLVHNVINCPVGVVPVTVVKPEDIKNLHDYPAPDGLHKGIKQCLDGAVGLPVAVQCYTRPWQEELCLRVMRDIQTTTHESIT